MMRAAWIRRFLHKHVAMGDEFAALLAYPQATLMNICPRGIIFTTDENCTLINHFTFKPILKNMLVSKIEHLLTQALIHM